MVGISSGDSAAHRARWLAELADALDEARCLVKEIATQEAGFDAIELSARIEAARFRVHTMRLKRSPGGGQDFGPEWSKDIPWKLSA
jgi:acyl-CoA reductase-like NAD-dependent aldehyde dehydrogenase